MCRGIDLGEGYQNISTAFKVPKNIVASIILKWKKFGNTKTLPRAGAQDLRLGRRFTFQQDNDPKHTAKTTQQWLRDNSECSRVAQSEPGLEHLWRDMKIAVQRRSPFNLTELERICREEWERLPKYRGAKLVVSYQEDSRL